MTTSVGEEKEIKFSFFFVLFCCVFLKNKQKKPVNLISGVCVLTHNKAQEQVSNRCDLHRVNIFQQFGAL